jgi:hypothetical protein
MVHVKSIRAFAVRALCEQISEGLLGQEIERLPAQGITEQCHKKAWELVMTSARPTPLALKQA